MVCECFIITVISVSDCLHKSDSEICRLFCFATFQHCTQNVVKVVSVCDITDPIITITTELMLKYKTFIYTFGNEPT